MELGEKIFRARQAAGLSQRQLCGDTITRNMLSQIEHGTAKPSMGTLKILAERLGKPVSYFLDEGASDPSAVMAALDVLGRAETAIGQGKNVLAENLLITAGFSVPELDRQRLLLLSRIPGADPEKLVSQLPGLDEELFLRARAALASGQGSRGLHLLEAMEVQDTAQWQLLRGELYLREENWQQAAACFHRAEGECPQEAAPKLEQCYRELGDFKQAYFYACKQKNRDA